MGSFSWTFTPDDTPRFHEILWGVSAKNLELALYNAVLDSARNASVPSVNVDRHNVTYEQSDAEVIVSASFVVAGPVVPADCFQSFDDIVQRREWIAYQTD